MQYIYIFHVYLREAGTVTIDRDDKWLKYSRFPSCVVPHSNWKILPFTMSAYSPVDGCPHTEAFLHSSTTKYLQVTTSHNLSVWTSTQSGVKIFLSNFILDNYCIYCGCH